MNESDLETGSVFAKTKSGNYYYVCEESFMSTELHHITTPGLSLAYRVGNAKDNMPSSVVMWAEAYGYKIIEVEITHELII